MIELGGGGVKQPHDDEEDPDVVLSPLQEAGFTGNEFKRKTRKLHTTAKGWEHPSPPSPGWKHRYPAPSSHVPLYIVQKKKKKPFRITPPVDAMGALDSRATDVFWGGDGSNTSKYILYLAQSMHIYLEKMMFGIASSFFFCGG